MKHTRIPAVLLASFWISRAVAGGTTEFCLDGQLDLGARYQGTNPEAGEFYPTTWCVVTENGSNRVIFSGSGKSNPDMDGGWTVAYQPPDTVRLVNRESPPDVEFQGKNILDEAMRVRRIDPRRLLVEIESASEIPSGMQVDVRDHQLSSVRMSADLPLRGRVDVEWEWDWTIPSNPGLRLMMDETLLFEATGRWRDISNAEAAGLWNATPGATPVKLPGDEWPAKIDMQLVSLADGVYLVRGVRTGFQHLVIDTDEGLLVADAPAGWVEFHHLPPSDLVPGLGVSGLSEKFIEFLNRKFPDRRIRVVAITHFHDDHAGGARAFAAAGATIFAPAESARFLQAALNRSVASPDGLASRALEVVPVKSPMQIGRGAYRVKLLPMGEGPHANGMIGVWVVEQDYFFVSDVHVPRSEAGAPARERAVTECWFAAWAVENLSKNVRVVNSHSTPVTPVDRLARYLDSAACFD